MAVESRTGHGGAANADTGGEEGGPPAEAAGAAQRAVTRAWLKRTHRIPLACRTVKLGTPGKGKAKRRAANGQGVVPQIAGRDLTIRDIAWSVLVKTG
jgi:hypothetical protein